MYRSSRTGSRPSAPSRRGCDSSPAKSTRISSLPATHHLNAYMVARQEPGSIPMWALVLPPPLPHPNRVYNDAIREPWNAIKLL